MKNHSHVQTSVISIYLVIFMFTFFHSIKIITLDVYNYDYLPHDESEYVNLKHKYGELVKHSKKLDFNYLPESAVVDFYIMYKQRAQGQYPNGIFDFRNGTVLEMQKCYDISFSLDRDYALYHLKDIYFTEYHSFILNDIIYTMDKWDWRYDDEDFPFGGAYDNALFVHGSFGTGYGDFMLGCMIRMIHFPLYLFPFSAVLVHGGSMAPFADEVLTVMNVEHKVELVNWLNWFYAKNLYCLFPVYKPKNGYDIHQSYYGPMATHFSQFMRKAFKLDTIIPYKYVIFNRGVDKSRGIKNIEEVTNTIKKNFPEHEYTTIPGFFSKYRDAAEAYAPIKWLFGGSGSNMMNCLFMAPGTGVLLFTCDWFDFPAMGSAMCAGCITLGFQASNAGHNGQAITIMPELLLRYISQHFEMMKNINMTLPHYQTYW